jgi:hypothetical protein
MEISFWDTNNRNQIVKTEFSYNKNLKSWLAFIVCSQSKRKCNDCLHKTKSSPKCFFGKKTGKKKTNNMQIFLKNILTFDSLLSHYKLRVTPYNQYLTGKYKFLIEYGFKLYYNEKNLHGYYEEMKEV